MRRIVFTILGLLELAVAVVLVVFSFQLPTAQDVDAEFGKLERVTRNTSHQVTLIRDRVHELRRPESQALAAHLQTQMKRVAETLRSQTIDFETVRAMSDALRDVSQGLDNLATTLDAERIGKLGDGLLLTANFLEERVAIAAGRAADQLEASTKVLKDNALGLATQLRNAPLDLGALRGIHDGLKRFNEGLEGMGELLKMEHLDTMRNGVDGLESSLNTAANQVERLVNYTYPWITFDGIKPVVEWEPLWPQGADIAEGLNKAAEGVAAVGKEMDNAKQQLPKLRASLAESSKVVNRVRETLALVLDKQKEVESLLKEVPEIAARLAEELPRLGTDLAGILRETDKFKQIAVQIREAHKALEGALARWPDLRNTIMGSARVLKATQMQLAQVVERREDYENFRAKTVELTEQFADGLPVYTAHIDAQLQQHEQSFDDLRQSVDEVSNALPTYAQTAGLMLQTTRWLLWFLAAVVAFHAGTWWFPSGREHANPLDAQPAPPPQTVGS